VARPEFIAMTDIDTNPRRKLPSVEAHNVYLSQQMLDISIALKTCAGNSRYFCRRGTTRMRGCLVPLLIG
jgi:hypothetical protein